jgi:ketosteroid isomerase-like protein
VTLLGPFDRPLAIRVIGPVGRLGRPPGSVPSRPDDDLAPAAGKDPHHRHAELTQLEVARRLTVALLADVGHSLAELDRLAGAIDEAVEVWSPSLYTTSRAELVDALAARDDAVVDLQVEVECVTELGRRVLVEWRVVGRFDNAGFLNDDVLVEPTHRSVESAGVMILTFRDGRVARIDCFFDALALLEQVLEPGGPG